MIAPDRAFLRFFAADFTPQAIIATVSLVHDLLHRGYRVMSTHHPLVLDVVWLVRSLQEARDARPKDLLQALAVHRLRQWHLRRRTEDRQRDRQKSLQRSK